MRSLRVKKRIIGVSTLILAIVLANIPVSSRAADPTHDGGSGIGASSSDALEWEIHNIDTKDFVGNPYSYNEYDATTGSAEELMLVIKGSGALKNMSFNAGSETPWKNYAQNIVKLVLPQAAAGESGGITAIGDYAFRDLVNLREIIVIRPNKNDPANVFYEEVSLGTGINLPTSLVSIGNYAFSGCESLTGELKLPTTGTFSSIGEGAFQGCKGLTGTLTIPVGVTTIPDKAFEKCTSLTGRLDLSHVTTIGVSAFEGCSKIEGPLLLSNNSLFTKISANAFRNCSNLGGTLAISDMVTEIGESAFSKCEKISGLSISATNSALTTIGSFAFDGCSGITGTVNIPKFVTEIPESAFAGCTGISSVYFTEDGDPLRIGKNAFLNCSSIEDYQSIPGRVNFIDSGAFYGTTQLNNVKFGGDAPHIEGEGGDQYSTSQSFKSQNVWLRFPKNANYWNYPKHRGYNTKVWEPTGDVFTVRDDRQPNSAAEIEYSTDPPFSDAFLLVNPSIDPNHVVQDHTLVITDTNSTLLSDQINLDAGRLMVVYNLDLMEYLGVSTTDMHKPCDKTYLLQVVMELPQKFDLKKGSIEGIWGLDSTGQKVDLGKHTPTDTTVQFNFSNDNVYKMQVGNTTHRYGEIAIIYKSDAVQFHIDDLRNNKQGAEYLRAGFTNTTSQSDTSIYDGYYLEIEDGDPKGPQGTSDYLPDLEELLEDRVDGENVFAGYNIRLMYKDTASAVPEEKETIPGNMASGQEARLSIRVPVPQAIQDAMLLDGGAGKLILYTTPRNYTRPPAMVTSPRFEIIPYNPEREGNLIKAADFTVTHFSAFGFVYTPYQSTLDPDFLIDDQRDMSNVNDIGEKTNNSFRTSITGTDQLKGYRLIITEVQDASARDEVSQELLIDSTIGQSFRVYKLTLVDKNDQEVDSTSVLMDPLQVTIPIPRRGLSDDVEWNPRENDTIKGYWRVGESGGFGLQPVIGKSSDGVETVTFDMPANGQLALVYTPRPATVDEDFAIVEDWMTALRNPDKLRSERYTSLTASYRNEEPQQHKGWTLHVNLVDENAQPYTNFKTALQNAGELDDDELMYVVSLDLRNEYDQSVNPDTTIEITMPILSMATGTPWDVDAIDGGTASVSAYRYYLTPPPESTPTNWTGFSATQPSITTTTIGDVRSLRFTMDEMLLDSERPGYIAVVYTPDRTVNPFTVDASTTDNPNGFYASFGPDKDPNYAGYVLEITNADASAFDDVINTNGMPVKAYTYTLRNKQTGEVVTNYTDPLAVRMTIPTSTGTGENTVNWVIGEPDEEGKGILYGVISYTGSGTTKELDTTPMTNTVPYGDTQVQFNITRNGDYGLQYRPNPQIEFEVIDRIDSSASVVGDGKTTRQTTYARSYPSYTDNRYLIFYDSTQRAIKPLIDADERYKDYLDIAIYDIFFQDQRNNGDDKTDHGTVQIGMQLPTSMHITDTLKVGVLTMLNGQLEQLETKNYTDTQRIVFDAKHFSEYALLYFDSASNSSTNASTGDSSATNASTGSSDGSTAGTTATGATTDSSTTATTSTGATTSSATGSTTSTGATTSSATGSTTSTGATTGSSSATASSTGSSASTVSTTGASSATNASTGSTIPTAYTTNPGSGSRPDMPKTGDPGMYRMMGSAGLGLFGIYELISSIRVREKGGKRRLYRR